MTENDMNPWYTNKDLFERLVDLKEDFTNLRMDMQETRTLIKSYNGLREELEVVRKSQKEIEKQVQEIISKNNGKRTLMEDFRNWGGWIVAVISLMILLYNQIV